MFLVSLVLTALLQFFMSYTMAMLAFWVLEVSTFIFILFAFEYIASGHLFPLDILPPASNRRSTSRRFPTSSIFPVSIYMGKITGTELVRGLLMQAGWVVVAYSAGALCLAARHQEILRRRRLNYESRAESPKVESQARRQPRRRLSTLDPRPSSATSPFTPRSGKTPSRAR